MLPADPFYNHYQRPFSQAEQLRLPDRPITLQDDKKEDSTAKKKPYKDLEGTLRPTVEQINLQDKYLNIIDNLDKVKLSAYKTTETSPT